MQMLKPAFEDYLWGGSELATLFGNSSERIAEAWVLSAHPNGKSIDISTGLPFEPSAKQMGAKCKRDEFPILIKYIDANSKLSLQVHPADTPERFGKTEMWIVLAAEPDSELAYGFNSAYDKQEVVWALKENKLENLVNFVKVKAGDVIFVPSGTLHGIGAGLLILEIQQNSDTTFRVYDYGRLQNGKPRELHIDEALECMSLTKCELPIQNISSTPENVITTVIDCNKFLVEKLAINGELTLFVEESSFKSLVVVSGSVAINGKTNGPGASVFIPAGFGDVELSGKAEIIISSV